MCRSEELLLILYVDASFSTGGGRSRTGIAMYLVNPIDGSESLVQWASRRQTSMATSAAEAEISAMAEGFAASIFLFDSLKELKLVKGVGPSCILSMKTDSGSERSGQARSTREFMSLAHAWMCLWMCLNRRRMKAGLVRWGYHVNKIIQGLTIKCYLLKSRGSTSGIGRSTWRLIFLLIQRGRERVSMIMAALFPFGSRMPPERQEKKVGRKKSAEGNPKREPEWSKGSRCGTQIWAASIKSNNTTKCIAECYCSS